jgi:hypothetical protein
MGVGVE